MHDDQPYPSHTYSPYHPLHNHTYLPRSHRSSLPHPIALSVSTETTSEHDPNETTARPGNAHKHAQFLGRPYAADDPGATPVVTHPPSTAASAVGLPAGNSNPDSASASAQQQAQDRQHQQHQQQQTSQPPSPSKNPAVKSAPSTTTATTTTTTTTNSSSSSSTNTTSSTTDYALNTPGISHGFSRPLTADEQEKLSYLDKLKFFLATAPSQWDSVRSNQSFAPTQHANAYPSTSNSSHALTSIGNSTGWGMGLPPVGATGPGPGDYGHGMHPSLNRFMLPSQEFVTCVLWNGLYHITGTDIVRALVFRFEAFGRPVRNMKKFEEGVFSDLRNLKPGVDACLEEPKSPFLDLLFKYQCIRTQKKQKVFYWFSVPHDRLFLDALERDLKREKMGLEPTTQVIGEPALSFTYDPKRSLYEQFAKAQGVKEGEGELEHAIRRAEQDGGEGSATSGESDAELADGTSKMGNLHIDSSATEDSEMSDADELTLNDEEREKKRKLKQEQQRKRHLQKIANANGNGAAFFSNLFLFEGSPTYKQRRKKNAASTGGGSTLSRSMSNSSGSSGPMRRGSDEIDERGRPRSIGSFPDRHHHHSHSTSVSRERSYPYPQPHPHYQPHHHYTYPGARPFSFPSMVDEFGPHSLDAKERAELNAAQLFHKQARGELVPADGVVRKPKVQHVTPDVGVLISEGYSAHRVQNQQHFGAPPIDAGSFPGDPGFAGYGQPPSVVDPSSSGHPMSNGNPGAAPYEALTPDGKFRAFICPLYSCGRLFKRMEHLKRHLRTHTMERPFMCHICQKRFSRSDNLSQHVRTHERSANAASSNGNAAAVVGGANNADFGSPAPGIAAATGTNMDMDTGGGGMSFSAGMNMGMWRDTGSNEESDLSGAESEGFDDDGFAFGAHRAMYAFQNLQHNQMQDQMIDMFGMGGVFDQMGPAGVFGNVGDMDAQMQMCAVEVQPGDVSEIPGGEEEGLVLRSGVRGQIPQGQYSGSLFSPYSNPSTDFAESQWHARPQPSPSPAFSNMSVPSPPPGSLPHSLGSNRSSIGTPPPGTAGYIPVPNTSSATASLPIYNGTSNPDDFVVTSLSAPSHIQAFDHASLYASSGLSESPGTGGPVRRQKSATPSLLRNGEPIRRPMTASSNESGEYPMPGQSGSPGSRNSNSGNGYNNGGMMGMGMNMNMGPMKMGMGVNVNMSGRGYHPYASGYATSSRPGSTHSSPAVYPVGLPEASQQCLRRPESRTSLLGGAGLQEQIQRHMLGLDAEHQQTQPGDVSGTSMFRTDSPTAFPLPQSESPAPYTIDLPHMYGQASGVAVGAYDIRQEQQQQQQFYSHS